MSAIRRMATLEEKLSALVTSSLWGNRVDLSLFQIAESSRRRDPFEIPIVFSSITREGSWSSS